MMLWTRSHRAEPRALPLADRHYTRQTPGAPQFVRAGSCAVFFAETDRGRALWVTVWQDYVDHAWPGAWECALFRNEGVGLSSDLIRDAVAATRAHYRRTPDLGMITFVNPAKVRHKRDPGRCFIRAGFVPIACTVNNRLLVLQMLPDAMPEPKPLAWAAPSLFSAEVAA